MNALEIDRRDHGEVTVLELQGDVTEQSDDSLRTAYSEAVDAGARAVVIGLAAAQYINTSGISVLITLAMDAQKSSVTMAVAGASPHYRKVFDLVQFSSFVTMFDDESAALAALG